MALSEEPDPRVAEKAIRFEVAVIVIPQLFISFTHQCLAALPLCWEKLKLHAGVKMVLGGATILQET